MSFNFSKEISGCGLSGLINTDRSRTNGDVIIQSIANLHDRGNGLGGGFAAYGIYPDYKNHYAFHLMYDTTSAKEQTEAFLKKNFIIDQAEEIPVRPIPEITDIPLLHRYFVLPEEKAMEPYNTAKDDYVVSSVMEINTHIDGAFVTSSGKNMGAFKAVGFPEDIGRFFKLEEYSAYIWTSHNRFPTNTQGWWGGAHPFTLLDWSIVHNGEISSYGINKRYIEMFGYTCTMLTDTEVVAYIFDLLVRKHKLPLEIACKIVTSSFWKDIQKMAPEQKKLHEAIRMVYGSALLNGPFAFLLAFSEGLLGINDRIKLRPLVAGRKGKTVYIASEEAAIREICPDPDTIWHPEAGEPCLFFLDKDTKEKTS